jgi:spoIIIJ-associated protein
MTPGSEQQLQRGRQWLESLLQLAGLPTQVTAQLIETSGSGPSSSRAGETGADASSSDPSRSGAADHEAEELSSYVGWLTVGSTHLTAEQLEILIGPHGQVIDSLQYLTSLITNLHQSPAEQLPFTVDLNDYRSKRLEELQALAEMAVSQVRETGEEYELKSLSSAERRQVHTLLKEFADIETYSRGREPDRRLVVHLRSSSYVE